MSPLELTTYIIALAIFIYYLITTTCFRYPEPLPPGPKPWPIVGNLPHMGPVPHQGLAAMAQKYGPLIYLRLGYVHVVVAASASVAAEFLKTHDSNFASRPPNSGAKHIAYNYQDMVFAPYGPRWRMLRKIAAVHLFSAKAMEDYKPIRKEEVGILTKALLKAEESNEAVDLVQLLYVCITNNLSRAMLGRRVFGTGTGKSDPKSEEFKDMVKEVLVLAGEFNIGDFVPALDCLDLQGIASKMKKLHKKFDNFLSAILEEYKTKVANGEHSGDFISTLVSLKDNCDDEGGKLSDTEIKALLLNMFIAGVDTSSSTIEWAIAELIRNPKIMAQVQQELDSIVGQDRLVNESDLPTLPYFQAMIKEVFRLHPATPLSLPRISAEPCKINGHYIPKNTTLLVNIWAIARDPNVWVDPLEFQPDRFLKGGQKPNVDVKGNDFELIPFGAGRRICAGIGLGIRMVQLVIATLVHGFDWKLPNGLTSERLNMEEAYGLGLRRKVPLIAHPITRLPAHAYNTSPTC